MALEALPISSSKHCFLPNLFTGRKLKSVDDNHILRSGYPLFASYSIRNGRLIIRNTLTFTELNVSQKNCCHLDCMIGQLQRRTLSRSLSFHVIDKRKQNEGSLIVTPLHGKVLTNSADQIEKPPVFLLNEKPERRHASEDKTPVTSYSEDDEGPGYLMVDPDHKSGYVALIGKPNVGKSTLMNQIIGQKLSIVTSRPQTTRHRILGICSAPHYQMVLFDTPGVISKKMHKLDEMMMQNVRTAAINADCVLVVVDASQIPEKVVDMLEEGAKEVINNRPTLLVLNKKDLIKPGEIAKKMEWYETYSGVDEVMAVSAKFGQGVDDLKDWLVSKLPYGPSYYPKDYVSDHPEKFFAAEIVREKIFMQYSKEVPYACQVNVLNYVERGPPAKDYIEIEILVEKDSQKGILIGKEGLALKTLATAARLDIEDFTGRGMFLDIKVKVKENWRKNEDLLRHYGYSGQLH